MSIPSNIAAPLTFFDAFGFYSAKRIQAEDNQINPENPSWNPSHASSFALMRNVITIAGYVPLIGTIAGIANLTFSYFRLFKMEDRDDPMEKQRNQGKFFRAVVQTLSIGAVLLIPDLIVTINLRSKGKF